MQANILEIRDENGLGKIHHTLQLSFSQARVSVRDIITERIFFEVEKYNKKTEDYLYALVIPTGEEQVLNQGKAKQVDPEKQLQIALKAFENNGFFILVNDKQVESLDEELVVEAGVAISFVKLAPLVGG